MDELLVIDGKGLILGRLATKVAGLAKKGVNVRIVNSEEIIITGDKRRIIKDFLEKLHRGNTERGPFYPKRPDRVVKRTVRGMINYKSPTGRKILSRVKTYISIPEELAGKISKDFKCKNINDLRNYKFIRIGELCKELGGKW